MQLSTGSNVGGWLWDLRGLGVLEIRALLATAARWDPGTAT